MKEKTVNPKAARVMAKTRCKAKKTPEERSGLRVADRVQAALRAARCFCGESSMWRAALRRFDCCRKAAESSR